MRRSCEGAPRLLRPPRRSKGGRQNPDNVEDFVLLLGTEEFVLRVVVDAEDELLEAGEEDEILDDFFVLLMIFHPRQRRGICPLPQR